MSSSSVISVAVLPVLSSLRGLISTVRASQGPSRMVKPSNRPMIEGVLSLGMFRTILRQFLATAKVLVLPLLDQLQSRSQRPSMKPFSGSKTW